MLGTLAGTVVAVRRVIFLSILLVEPPPHMHVEISLGNLHRVLKGENGVLIKFSHPNSSARSLEYNLSYY